MKTLMAAYGAYVIALPTFEDRYIILRRCISEYGWYPLTNATWPPVGSSPFGVEGYRTLAYEIWQQLGGRVPDWLVVPMAFGDTLSGAWRGFLELERLGLADRLPRLVAAERFGPLARHLTAESATLGPVETEPTAAFSIGTAYATYQAAKAVKDSRGRAVAVAESSLLAMQRELAVSEGLFAEASSVAALAALAELTSDGTIRPSDVVIVLLTSSGLKDPGATSPARQDAPVIQPTIPELVAALAQLGADPARLLPSQ
jgi:threonine synthase